MLAGAPIYCETCENEFIVSYNELPDCDIGFCVFCGEKIYFEDEIYVINEKEELTEEDE